MAESQTPPEAGVTQGRAGGVLGAPERAVGAVAVGLFMPFRAFVRFAARLEVWVFLVLVAKPLVDLAWPLYVLELGGQKVNSQAALGMLVVILTLLAARRRWRDFIRLRRVYAYLMVATLSFVITPTGSGVNELLRLFAGVAFFFIGGLALDRQERFDRFARLFLYGVVILIVLSGLQLAELLPYEYWDYRDGLPIGRVSATYRHPLGLVFVLMYGVPLALYLRDRQPERSPLRAPLVVLLGLMLLVAVFTYHRAGLAAIALEIGVWFMLTRKHRTIYILAGTTVGLGLVIALLDQIVLLYAPMVGVFRGEVGVFDQDFLRGRGVQWFVFLSSLWTGGPLVWLLGRGGSEPVGFEVGLDFWGADEPHNDFIRIVHAYGAVGLSIYIAILARIINRARRLRRLPDQYARELGALILTIIPAFFLLSITAEPSRYPTGIWYLLAFASTAEVITARAEAAASAAPTTTDEAPLLP